MQEATERLSEEDLVPGKPWVHPDTRLEYEDFTSYFLGHDPRPHWRNAQIKRIHAAYDDKDVAIRAIEEIFRLYDRWGQSVSQEADTRRYALTGQFIRHGVFAAR